MITFIMIIITILRDWIILIVFTFYYCLWAIHIGYRCRWRWANWCWAHPFSLLLQLDLTFLVIIMIIITIITVDKI